ncbi:nitrite reductase small subunit NirD [Nocardiopsis sp. CNT-189]|uniref:nitrite reductase small subunit NirD n=1 Tax=Nocardiopsis oceanisediminis TaxID=2816862 RepID=UPI003B29CE49
MTAPTTAPHRTAAPTWVPACASHRLQPERGVAVLLPGGAQAALFRTHDGALYALDNTDPFTGAAVLSRGIVGDRAGEPTVASPMLKHRFALRTGASLDDPGVRLAAYPVLEDGGRVFVGAEPL